MLPRVWNVIAYLLVSVDQRLRYKQERHAIKVESVAPELAIQYVRGQVVISASNDASLAQLAEHALHKRTVVGSIPTGGFFISCR